MNSAVGLFIAALVVMVLTYTKPDWFWNTPKMQRSRQGMSQSQEESIMYGLCAVLMVLAVVALIFGF
ncbi:MAG: hypothetical protein EA342_02250 [Leptolyngbya sp. LCM1.Bin17]|nr:MAG: hypothetical protein EA342_02250 [Leptolyngbya sp. LCM1.Bin17]